LAIAISTGFMVTPGHGDNGGLGAAPDLLAFDDAVEFAFKEFIAEVADADGQPFAVTDALDLSGRQIGVMFQIQLDAGVADGAHFAHTGGKVGDSFDKVTNGIDLNGQLWCQHNNIPFVIAPPSPRPLFL
jgi:hypothetical protein